MGGRFGRSEKSRLGITKCARHRRKRRGKYRYRSLGDRSLGDRSLGGEECHTVAALPALHRGRGGSANSARRRWRLGRQRSTGQDRVRLIVVAPRRVRDAGRSRWSRIAAGASGGGSLRDSGRLGRSLSGPLRGGGTAHRGALRRWRDPGSACHRSAAIHLRPIDRRRPLRGAVHRDPLHSRRGHPMTLVGARRGASKAKARQSRQSAETNSITSSHWIPSFLLCRTTSQHKHFSGR